MAEYTFRLLEQGYRLQQSGDSSGAERLYRRTLGLDPGDFHALNLLGALCANSNRPDEATRHLSRALEIADDDPQTHANIALAWKDLGELQLAVRHMQESIRLDASNPVIFNNLGNMLRLQERPSDAVRSFEAALRLRPAFAECWSNLSAALNEANRHDHALSAVARALQLEPKLAQAWNNKGDILLNQAKYAEALDCYRKATELDPKYSAAMINMARVQRDMNVPDEAVATLKKVLELEPRDPQAHQVLGVLREQMGDREGAIASFRAAIELAPEMTIAHYNLAQIKGRRSTDEEYAAMLALWELSNLLPSNRMYLAHGLYRAAEQHQAYDAAFGYLVEGNRIKAQARPYDDQDTGNYMDSIVAATELLIGRLGRDVGCPDPRPVFVLGMPRSGTSLTEQVLASHSMVAGAGELSYAYDMVHRVRDITGGAFPDNIKLLSVEQFRSLGAYYLSRHSSPDLEFPRFVDKTPLNFQYIGLLALALPGARFLHCHREPVANCFAIHRMPFDERQTYAHDLAALGRYYSRYWRLMQHWKTLFPGRILDVSYEDTVADAESQSRRMLEFLELPFEDSVLTFYETRRLVKTPSASQVREPIYTDSVTAWKKYEKHLRPLMDNLVVDGERRPAPVRGRD